MSNFGYKVPGDEDPTDTPENNVATALEVQEVATGPEPVDTPGEPITTPEGNLVNVANTPEPQVPVNPEDVPGDDVPEDTEGDTSDRTEALTDPDHTDIEDVPDDVAASTGEVPTEDAPDPNTDPAVTDVPVEGGEGAAAPADG